jgi:hypothetical protein
MIYWFTDKDDETILSPIERIKHYCYKSKCGIRLYALRGNKTIIRYFGHNDTKHDNINESAQWKTRHYEMRSVKHFKNKLIDRCLIKSDGDGCHYRVMSTNLHENDKYGTILSSQLHYDDGNELSTNEIFNWSVIY